MKNKIYSILGDFYHEHDLILSSLKEAVKAVELDIELVDSSESKIQDIINEKPDLIIMNKENRINPQEEEIHYWMTPEIEQAIIKYVSDGGNLLVWHAGLASYDQREEFVKVVKGYFKWHPSENKPVSYIPSDEDSTSPSFEVLDEHYFIECDEEHTDVFLRAESVDGKSIAGWKHRFHEGKVCCITPSHREEGLLDPAMIQLLANSIEWCLVD